MAASTALASVSDVRAFIAEYYKAWSGTDEDHILSYYAEAVSVELPGMLLNGKAALRDQFVRPFIAAFAGNRHIVKNMIFGKDVVVVEFLSGQVKTGHMWSLQNRPCGPGLRSCTRLSLLGQA
jgi:ketosteroid isomerase-like protein